MRSSRNKILQSLAVFCLSAAVTVLLSACARPPSATVNQGADPFHADKDVVFRTTYYFRVFDHCVARKVKRGKIEEVHTPLADSLYRFRMTGKAASNVSKVKFESGTLMAWEIDPFGAKVEFDPDLGRARVIPPREIEADVSRAAQKQQIYEMLEMYSDISSSKFTNSGDAQNWKDELSLAIRGKINRFVDRTKAPLIEDNVSDLIKREIKDLLDEDTGDFAVQMFEKHRSSILDETKIGSPDFLVRVVRKTIWKAIETTRDNREKLAETLITLKDEKNEKANWGESQSKLEQEYKTLINNILPNLIKPAIRENLADNDIGDTVVRVFEENSSSILAETKTESPDFLVNVVRQAINKAISANSANKEKLNATLKTLKDKKNEKANWGESQSKLEQEYKTLINNILPNLIKSAIRENLADDDIGDIVVGVFEEHSSSILRETEITNQNFLVDVVQEITKKAISTNSAYNMDLTATLTTLSSQENEEVKKLIWLWGKLKLVIDQPVSPRCPGGTPERRGFQVLGPEGWRTFNPDERLILAMSTSAKPLISTLKELSNRVINSHENPAAELLLITREQKILSDAGYELYAKQAEPRATVESITKAVCEKLVDSIDDKGKICK